MTFVTQNSRIMYNSSTASNSTYIRPARCGKHKIFIGMAPGVGKTYKMLDEAQRLKQDGIDVVIGWLETHGRQETAAKALGLEVIPPKTIEQGELILTEMDTDAIITRQSQLVLVDQLAHTHFLELEQNRRYQDVEAILAAGIDVYSTVNIQHIESLSNLVTQITGVVVKECIPDRLLEMAEELVVVDVTPETLEERLLDGKIYPLEKIEQELQNFFQHRNLVALRELALREVADNIEKKEIREASQLNCNRKAPTGKVCNIHERILVCISTQPQSLRLIRRGAMLADYMKASLYVLFINNPDRCLTKDETRYIENCKQLCLEFKGEFLQSPDYNIPEGIAKVAKSYRITQVVLGQSPPSRWQFMLGGSLINQLMRRYEVACRQTSLTHIDLHIISSEKISSSHCEN